MTVEPREKRDYYRMPVGFGPALGPRRGPGGTDFNGTESRATSLAVSYAAEREAVSALLPPGFEPAEKPAITVRANFGRDYAWLAGRGYNYVEVVFPAIYRGQEDVVEGDFVAVMWESIADPIISGREEIGLPKLFAEVPDHAASPDGTLVTASWDGFRFLTMSLEGLSIGPWPSADEEATEWSREGLGGTRSHRLHYKHFPRTGELERADVAYATATPPGAYRVKVLERWSGAGNFEFHAGRWEDLPTLAHVVDPLAALELGDPLGATMTRLVIEFNDLGEQRVLR